MFELILENYTAKEYRWPRYREFLYVYALSYEVKQKDWYKAFLDSFWTCLPCDECKANFQDHDVQFDYSSSENLFKSILLLHNTVRESQDKEKVSYEEMLEYIWQSIVDSQDGI